MKRESDHDFHLRRAREELDLAYRTDRRVAIEAHLRLSSLHMQKLTRIHSSEAERGRSAPAWMTTPVGVFARPRPIAAAREVEAVSG